MKKLFAILLSFHLIIAPMPLAHAKEGGGGAGGIAKQILGIGNSIVGSTIIVKCKMASMQPSLMVYMAGSLVYIASELAGGKKQQEQQKNQSKTLDNLKANMTEGGDYQKGAIDAQLKDEKDKLEVIQGRRKWMMATKTIYATATALAIWEWIRHFPPPPAGIGLGIPDVGACAPNPAANMAIVKAVALAYTGISAYASNGVMGVAAVGATAAVTHFFPKLAIGAQVSDMTMTALNLSLGRVAVFAAATALVMVVDGELAKEEKATQKRIADLEKVKSQFNEMSSGGTKLAEGSSNNQIGGGNGQNGKDGKDGVDSNDPAKTYELQKLADASKHQKKSCFSVSNGATQYGEDSCSDSLKLTRPAFNPQFSIPTLVAGANTATDLGNAVARGDLASADVQAAKLASMAGRIDAVKDSMMKKLNSDLVAQGKKPINVEDTIRDQLNALNKGINEKYPGEGNYTMDDLGFGKANAGGAALGTAPDLASAGSLKAEDIKGVTAAPAVGIPPTGVAGGSSFDINSFEAAGNLDAAGVDEAGLVGTDQNPLGDKFETALAEKATHGKDALGNEINPDRDSSLFKQVSDRYLLNYTKFFQRKEINPPLTGPQATN